MRCESIDVETRFVLLLALLAATICLASLPPLPAQIPGGAATSPTPLPLITPPTPVPRITPPPLPSASPSTPSPTPLFTPLPPSG